MSYLPEQNRKYLLARYYAHRGFFISMLGGKCKRCRSIEDLEIDHVDPKIKEIELGALFTKRNIVAAVAGLVMKCQLLCRKCHSRKTARENARRLSAIRHGSMYAWMKLKCPCEICIRSKWAWQDRRNVQRRGGANAYPRKRVEVFGEPLTDEAARPSRLMESPKHDRHAPRPHLRKVARPSAPELQGLIWQMPTSRLARQFGVSDTAIAKWCKALAVTKPPRGYWTGRS